MKNQSNQLKWLENQINNDKQELEREKLQFIQQIKKMDKNEIVPKPKKKLTIWQRLMKVLMG
jgi:hypothetical protein